MKSFQKDKNTEDIMNFTLPEQEVLKEDLLRSVKEEEEGLFITAEEAMVDLGEWIKARAE